MSDSYLDLVPLMIRYESQMAIIILMCAVAAFISIQLWRRMPQFRSIAALVSRVAVPLYIAPLNPVLALLASPTGFLPIPRKIPRPLLLIVLLAAGVRIPQLFQNLWYDETFSARMAQMDWPQFWAATARDIHPPLHNLMLMFWAQIGGSSAAWLRLPELGFGLLSIVLMYKVARALRLDNRVALIAALIMAIMPSAVYYAVELRAYALMSCLLLGALLAVLHNRSFWFLAMCPLMYLTHHYGLFYSAVFGLAGFLYWRNREWFITSACLAVGMLLWLPFVFAQSGVVSDGFWIYNSPGNVIRSFVDMLTKASGNYAALTAPAAVLLFVSLYSARRWILSRHGLLWSSLVFGVPFVAMLVSYLYLPVFVSRYLYPSMILLAIPIAIAISKSQLLGRAGLALAIVGIGVLNVQPRTPFRQLAAQYCPQATAFYHLNLEAAFTLSYAVPNAQHLVRPDARDQGAGLDPDDVPIFGFETGDIEALRGQSVCVMYIDSALTLAAEKSAIRWLERRYPNSTGSYEDRGFNYVFYQFAVQ